MRIRPEKVAQMMRRETADILANKLRDPGMAGMVSVTDVELTHDLASARIHVSVYGDEATRTQVMETLRRATPFVRREIGHRIGLREVPEIRFLLDTSLDRGARVEDLLRRIQSGETIEDEDVE